MNSTTSEVLSLDLGVAFLGNAEYAEIGRQGADGGGTTGQMIRAKLDASLKIFGPVGDALIVGCAVLLADPLVLSDGGHILALYIPVCVMVCALFGGYECDLEDRHQTMAIRLTVASLVSGLVCSGMAAALRVPLPVAGWLGWLGFCLTVAVGWFAVRRVGYSAAKWLFSSSQQRKRVLLVCEPDLRERFEVNGSDELEVMGWLTPPSFSGDPGDALGRFDSLQAVVDEHVVHEVLVLGTHSVSDVSGMARCCEEIGVDFSLDSGFLGLELAVAQLDKYGGYRVLRFTTTPFPADALVIKRLIDVFGASCGLLLLSPLMLAAAVLVKLDDPSAPVFFRQTRSGMYGKPFRMWKFRTMVADAEALKAELEAQNEMSGAAFKIAHDPRITPVGRYLRKTSIDELPQLWNVFVGDMSLVGPRPLIPREERGYERWQLRRLSVRPGITGLWQVSGRNDVDFETWMLLDMQYLDNWTIGLDIRLLLKTIPAVISGAGAS